MAGPQRIVLRLDDGSLVGSASVFHGSSSSSSQGDGVVKLSVMEAFKLGRIGEADVARLERLLHAAETARAGGGTSNGKRPASAAPTHHAPPVKRQRPSPSPAQLAADMKVCQQLMQKMFKKLGKYKATYYLPVTEAVAPNYYSVIKEPICLQQIEQRLKQGQYASAEDFAYDVRLVWSNALLYNARESWIYKEALNTQKWFETHWAQSGLDPDHPVPHAPLLQPAPSVQRLPSVKPEPSAAATSDYQGSGDDFGPENPRRSRRPRVPNRRLSSPSMDGSQDDDDGVHGGLDNRAQSKETRWSEERLNELQRQMELLQEKDADAFQEAVQTIVLADPFYSNFDFSTEELTLTFDGLQPSTLAMLDADIQHRLYGKPPPPPQPPAADAGAAPAAPAAAGATTAAPPAAAAAAPASMHPSPHSTQTSMQQQQQAAAAEGKGGKGVPAMDTEHKLRLTNALGNLEPDHYPRVFELLKSSGVAGTDTDEYELDLDDLSDLVCWQLDALARELLGGKYDAPARPAGSWDQR